MKFGQNLCETHVDFTKQSQGTVTFKDNGIKVNDVFITEIISHVQATYKAYISFGKQLAKQKLFFLCQSNFCRTGKRTSHSTNFKDAPCYEGSYENIFKS